MSDENKTPIYHVLHNVRFGKVETANIDLENKAVEFKFDPSQTHEEGVIKVEYSLDLDAINDQLASVEFVYKPDVTLTYNGRIVDSLWDMFFPPNPDDE